MGKTGFSIDRPRFAAIVLSATTNQVYVIPDVEQLTTRKGDDGSSGTWSIISPITKEYLQAKASYPRTLEYAPVAGPMDLVALYAWRNTATQSGVGPTELDPLTSLAAAASQVPLISAAGSGVTPALALAALTYGDPSAATVTTLGNIPVCLMIGMVDRANYTRGYSGSRSQFSFSGRDLTKIFEVNWTTVPSASQAGLGGVSSDESAGFFGMAQVVASNANTGATFLTAVLDLLCAKDLTQLSTLTKNNQALPSQQTISAYKQFGYPWRNFVRTDALDPSYQPFTAASYPPYSPQMGSVWATVMELRNPPISRLYVNEIGQLIYDDAYNAWIDADPIGTITTDIIRDFDESFDDANMLTFLSILPLIATGGNTDVAKAVGNFLQGTGFVNGISAAASGTEAHVATYGYRFAQFQSMFDISYVDAAKRQKYWLESQNNIFSATLVVKGDAKYRVGQRWMINDGTRPETTNQVWYFESVEHQCMFGNDWTTTIGCRYPTMPYVGAVT